MPFRILIMGLPGSGKTTLAKELQKKLRCTWYNADIIRKLYKDWDFSEEGRLRQAWRMKQLADDCNDQFVIVDFVAPLTKMRDIYDADFTIWMDTIDEGRFEDTNKAFVPPSPYECDVQIKTMDAEIHAENLFYVIWEKLKLKQNIVKENSTVSKDRFDFEQEIMQCWNIVEELKVLHEGVLERDLTRDQISNILLGLGEMYQLRFEILFDTFEQSVKRGEIK